MKNYWAQIAQKFGEENANAYSILFLFFQKENKIQRKRRENEL